MTEKPARRRRWFRFSLKTMLVVVLVLAVFCSALANPTLMFARITFAIALILLLYGTLAAFVKRQPFGIGFAVVGWVYFALTFNLIFFSIDHRFLLTDFVLDRSVVALCGELEERRALESALRSLLSDEDSPQNMRGSFRHSGRCL